MIFIKIKLRNKLTKKIMPIQTVQGKVEVDENTAMRIEAIGTNGRIRLKDFKF